MIGVPVIFCQRSATAACKAMPPATEIRRLRGGFFANHGEFKRPLNKVFTPEMKVIGIVSKALRRLDSGLGLGIKILCAPRMIKPKEVHGEREDMVERQHGQNMVAFAHVIAPETEELRDIHDQDCDASAWLPC